MTEPELPDINQLVRGQKFSGSYESFLLDHVTAHLQERTRKTSVFLLNIPSATPLCPNITWKIIIRISHLVFYLVVSAHWPGDATLSLTKNYM